MTGGGGGGRGTNGGVCVCFVVVIRSLPREGSVKRLRFRLTVVAVLMLIDGRDQGLKLPASPV